VFKEFAPGETEGAIPRGSVNISNAHLLRANTTFTNPQFGIITSRPTTALIQMGVDFTGSLQTSMARPLYNLPRGR
jgi:hypothetical protein